MSIQFSQVDANNRTPGVFTEFDASRAVNALQVLTRVLMIGQRTSAGTAIEGSVNEVQSLDSAKSLFGVGSHLADMVDAFLLNNPNIRITAIPLDDAGTAATKTITITGTATEAGVLFVYVAGRRIQVTVASGDTADDIAASIDAAIDANTDLIFTATSATNVVTLTAVNEGEWTEGLPVSVNPFPPEKGGSERTPAGISAITVADGTTGAGNPAISTAIAAIPDERFDYILQPYNDDTNMDLMDAELLVRQGAMVQLEGHAFNSFAGTLGAATTFGTARNSQHSTTIHAGNGSLSPEHHWAAAYIGRASDIASRDPAVPWQFQPLVGILPEPAENRLIRSERNTLLQSGVATHVVTDSGIVQIERGITNYQQNALSQPDTSFLDSMTPLTLSFLRQSFLQRMTNIYGVGFKLVKDGGNISAGQNIASPQTIRGDVIALAQDWVDLGLVEELGQFKTDLIVQVNISDPNRVDVQMSPDLVNQLRIIANKILFIL
jgi:phage tail sheath gpL-like